MPARTVGVLEFPMRSHIRGLSSTKRQQDRRNTLHEKPSSPSNPPGTCKERTNVSSELENQCSGPVSPLTSGRWYRTATRVTNTSQLSPDYPFCSQTFQPDHGRSSARTSLNLTRISTLWSSITTQDSL